MKAHGIPFDSLETVEDFKERVKNVIPRVNIAYVEKPLVGPSYVLISIEQGMDAFTLIAEVGDELKVLDEKVWIKAKEESK